MAITERTTSRRITYNNGAPVGIREFHVYPYPTEASVIALLDGVNLPAKLSPWPIGLSFTPAVGLVVYDFEIIRDPVTPQAWTVNIVYRERGDNVLTPDLSPNDAGYVNMRMSAEVRGEDAWRQWFSKTEQDLTRTLLDQFYRPIYAVGDPAGDIGGIKIDVAGHPTTILRYTQTMQLELITNALPRPGFYNTYLGTRNVSTFVNCELGSTLFTGADASQVSPGKWQVIFNFAVDFFFHLKQLPKRQLNGYVELDLGFVGGISTGQAKVVSYVQPFPQVTEFRDLDRAFRNLP